MNIPDTIEAYADNMRIVWDDENMQPTRELVHVGWEGWEVRQIGNYKSIIITKDFKDALQKLINP